MIDLRLLRPLDDATIVGSVRRTHRASSSTRAGARAASPPRSRPASSSSASSSSTPRCSACARPRCPCPMPSISRRRRCRRSRRSLPRRARWSRDERLRHAFARSRHGLRHGDRVAGQAGRPGRRGEPMAVVDTDKAAVEIESFQSGVVGELLVEPGQRVDVGTPLARLLPRAGAPQRPGRPRPETAPTKRDRPRKAATPGPSAGPAGHRAPAAPHPTAAPSRRRARRRPHCRAGTGPKGDHACDVDAAARRPRVSPYARTLARGAGGGSHDRDRHRSLGHRPGRGRPRRGRGSRRPRRGRGATRVDARTSTPAARRSGPPSPR